MQYMKKICVVPSQSPLKCSQRKKGKEHICKRCYKKTSLQMTYYDHTHSNKKEQNKEEMCENVKMIQKHTLHALKYRKHIARKYYSVVESNWVNPF